jgi:hypothetical protein
MSIFVVDVEADGPAPGIYSMVSFGIVKVDMELKTTFKGIMKPISTKWIPEALAISKITRDQHLDYPEPELAMFEFKKWLIENNTNGRPIFISDNLAFDWQFINYYSHLYLNENPFGFSGRRIGDLYSGAVKDFFASGRWRKFKKTPHTHDPVDDAMGNAEALLEISRKFNIKLPL